MATRKDGTVQLNTTIEQEWADKFRKMCSDRDVNLGEGMKLAIEAWDVNELANKMPGRREEIDRFMACMETITEIFKNSLKICDESREKVRHEFEEQVEIGRKQLNQQSNEIDRLKAEVQSAEAENGKALNEANEHIDCLKDNVQRETDRADQAEARVVELERQLADAATMADMLAAMQKMINHHPDNGSADDNPQ